MIGLSVLSSAIGSSPSTVKSADLPPFRLPFLDLPGISTRLLGHAYGNTTGAYQQGKIFYEAGQGLHFGLNLTARCGYPIAAIGDGIVTKVDALEHGSAPHNLWVHPR